MRAVSAIWSTLTASKLASRNSRVATSMRSSVIWPACSLVGRPLCRRGLLAGLALVTFIQLFSLGHFRRQRGARRRHRQILLISACIPPRKHLIVRYRLINRARRASRAAVAVSRVADGCALIPRGTGNEADEVDFPDNSACRACGLSDRDRRARQCRQ